MRALRFCAFAGVLALAVGCGSRTGLLVLDEGPGEPEEAGVDAADDQTVPREAEGPEAAPLRDVAQESPVDAGLDATADVTVDALADVVPTLDVTAPRPIACQEAGAAATLIYVITQQYDLWSFYPPSLAFTRIGRINCPARPPALGDQPATPFSMAVDHTGTAYVVYSDGELFRVSTASAHCTPTPFVMGQEGFTTFGMGFSQNPTGNGETLYVASDGRPDGGLPSRLGLIDTTSFMLHTIGPFPSQVVSAELTGTGAGDLFAFYSLATNTGDGPSPPPSAIGQIDKATGGLLGQTPLPTVGQGCAWAFAFWGGDFYTFTAPAPTGSCTLAPLPLSVVTRFRSSDGSIQQIATFGEEVVGAGVSTCAPQE